MEVVTLEVHRHGDNVTDLDGICRRGGERQFTSLVRARDYGRVRVGTGGSDSLPHIVAEFITVRRLADGRESGGFTSSRTATLD